LVFFYSGHGSYALDLDGDETDGWDEVICLYDEDFLDDDFRKILNKIPTGVSMTIILDCCFGGTGTRFVSTDKFKKKFRPPKGDIPKTAKRRKSFLADESMPEILLSACSDNEYSYEDENGGVFTRIAINILNSSYPMTYVKFKEVIDKRLPTRDYPQTPQLEGSVANKGKTMFGYAAEPEPEPPTPDPEPEPDTEPWCTCFRAMKKYYLKLKRKFKKR
jgi:hypothetical protein